MKKYDRTSSLICVCIAVAICFESIRLGPGALSSPGPGFVPLGCGMVLGIMGIIVFIRTYLSSTFGGKVVIWEPGTRWGAMILAIISLIIYALSMNFIGFYIMTFLWMIFTCRWISRLGWGAAILITVGVVIFNYIVISYYLGVRFPVGIILWP